jgi:hypothetical protein
MKMPFQESKVQDYVAAEPQHVTIGTKTETNSQCYLLEMNIVLSEPLRNQNISWENMQLKYG